jgi:hypothetical protein
MRSPRHLEIDGALASVGSLGGSYDNALAETTIGQSKTFPPDTVTAWAHAASSGSDHSRPDRAPDWTCPG